MYALDIELIHGYTIGDLQRIARLAVNTDWSHHAGDYLDRFDLAMSAVAEGLYAADQPPTERDLVRHARYILHADAQTDLRHRGRSHHTYDTAVNAVRYWTLLQVTPSHESAVVDRQALWQIWPRLRDDERRALATLATYGDYAQAAEALGLRYHTFCTQVGRARKRFFRLWHEGEKPSEMWGRDRRAAAGHVPAANPKAATRIIGVRRAAARRAARDA